MVVVPTRNSVRTIGACLASIRRQTISSRIVVVDNHSSDRTVEIARQYADVVVQAGPERSAQRNRGAESGGVDILGFIDSDMVLHPKVLEQAVDMCEQGAAGVIVPERTVGYGFWTEVRAFERSFYQGDDFVEAARFFRSDVFFRVGGFDTTLTGAEDWDLTLRVRECGDIARIDEFIDHDEGRVKYFQACAKKAYYARGLQRFFTKHGSLVARQMFRRPFWFQPRQLISPLGVGLVLLKGGEAVAVAAVLLRSRLALRSHV